MGPPLPAVTLRGGSAVSDSDAGVGAASTGAPCASGCTPVTARLNSAESQWDGHGGRRPGRSALSALHSPSVEAPSLGPLGGLLCKWCGIRVVSRLWLRGRTSENVRDFFSGVSEPQVISACAPRDAQKEPLAAEMGFICSIIAPRTLALTS